jgi:hypothetical protein
MAMDLDDIFPGIGLGLAHENEQDLIQDGLVIGTDDFSQVKTVRAKGGRSSLPAEDLGGDGLSLGTTEAYNAYAPNSQGRGDGRYGISQPSPVHEALFSGLMTTLR